MRTLIAAAALVLTSTFALAYPSVNDTAKFAGSYTVNGVTYPTTLQWTLTKYNASIQQYLQTEDQVYAGQTSHTERWVNESEVLTPRKTLYIIANCVARKGTSETVTPPAGSFETCKVLRNDAGGAQTFWVADVPFGLAQFDNAGTLESGAKFEIHYSLTSAESGQ